MESKFKREKLFYSIAEVADKFNVNQSLLRYLEKEYPSLQPVKTAGKNRQYRQEDIEEIGRILQLKEQGYTSKGIKDKLKDNRSGVERLSEAKNRLQGIRSELLKLQTEFDELDREYFGVK
ncbi:MAG: MerR family transcriptional regulator [Dysgonamonadaceae bacterium]|jgi:DNA-binding transcriptional MerR regulator|nr:MerR family transcriptional regulator [Dysgonamonadaceae bacterium]